MKRKEDGNKPEQHTADFNEQLILTWLHQRTSGCVLKKKKSGKQLVVTQKQFRAQNTVTSVGVIQPRVLFAAFFVECMCEALEELTFLC